MKNKPLAIRVTESLLSAPSCCRIHFLEAFSFARRPFRADFEVDVCGTDSAFTGMVFERFPSFLPVCFLLVGKTILGHWISFSRHTNSCIKRALGSYRSCDLSRHSKNSADHATRYSRSRSSDKSSCYGDRRNTCSVLWGRYVSPRVALKDREIRKHRLCDHIEFVGSRLHNMLSPVPMLALSGMLISSRIKSVHPQLQHSVGYSPVSGCSASHATHAQHFRCFMTAPPPIVRRCNVPFVRWRGVPDWYLPNLRDSHKPITRDRMSPLEPCPPPKQGWKGNQPK